VALATAAIRGERSKPTIGTPASCRCLVTRPAPQPTSATIDGLVSASISAYAARTARSSGVSADMSGNISAYCAATASHAARVAGPDITGDDNASSSDASGTFGLCSLRAVRRAGTLHDPSNSADVR
jgi:hypothetical protein